MTSALTHARVLTLEGWRDDLAVLLEGPRIVDLLHGKQPAIVTTARSSLESHLIAFAAEQARLDGSVIEMPSFRAQAEEQARIEARQNTL